MDSFPSHSFDLSILPRQPFRLKLFHSLLLLSKDADSDIANLLQEGMLSGAFSKIQLAPSWEPNTNIQDEVPDLQICKDNWTSVNKDPAITEQLIQKELADGFIEEIPDIATAEKCWPQGIALGKLGVVHAGNRDPRLVLDSTICGMNGRCHLRGNVYLTFGIFPSFCLPAPLYKRNGKEPQLISKQLTRECSSKKTRGDQFSSSLVTALMPIAQHTLEQKAAHGTGAVSHALMRLLHCLLYFRHAMPGFMWMTSFSLPSINIFHPVCSSDHSTTGSKISFIMENLSLTQALNGMDGLSNQHL